MTARQTKALQALLTEPTRRAAAKKAGISESTLRSYLATPDFQENYRVAFSELVTDATRQIQQAISPAVSTLRGIVESADEPATARIQASRAILEFALRMTEALDIVGRVEEMERTISELEGKA